MIVSSVSPEQLARAFCAQLIADLTTGFLSPEERKEYALAIVRAVNAHADLVAALEQLVQGWPGEGATINVHARVFKQARAALAKAKGETP